MFGKETLLIPTRPVPIGCASARREAPRLLPRVAAGVPAPLTPAHTLSPTARSPEYSAWAGMIGVHYGRHAAGRAHSALGGGCHSAALSELRGYYSTGASLATSPGFSDDEDEAGPGRRRGRPSEVELMARQHGGFSHGSPSADDRLRRRTYCEDGFGAPGASTPPPAQRPPLFGAGSEGRALLGAAMPDLRDLQRRSARWKDQVLSRLKRVASQPTLAPATSLGQAADAAITSMLAGPPAGSSVAQHAQQLMYNAATAQRPKDGGKAD